MARLSDGEVRDELTSMSNWTYTNGAIVRTLTFPSFMAGIGFVNQVAELAEDAGHHPDITISYTRITLALSTHDAGGITDKDVSLARRIDALGGM
jgi:4a-hydroxytetrahydrobiopterin dehydratase